MKDYSVYLKDIIQAIEAIEKFVEGISLKEFKNDDKTSSAVVRKFEIIGEAAKKIPENARKKYPQVPWKEMSGMRDKLIHFYAGVNFDLVWQTIQNQLPSTKSIITQILKELNSSNSSDKRNNKNKSS